MQGLFSNFEHCCTFLTLIAKKTTKILSRNVKILWGVDTFLNYKSQKYDLYIFMYIFLVEYFKEMISVYTRTQDYFLIFYWFLYN